MKKNILILVALIFSCNVFAQEFETSNLRIGGGLVYATEVNNIGLTFNGTYSFTEHWEAAFAYSHIFENDLVSFNIYDFDGHFVFHEQSDMNFYSLVGLGITTAKADLPAILGGKVTDTNVGLNLGIGMNYQLAENWNLAPEARFTITDDSYFRIGASIQYLF